MRKARWENGLVLLFQTLGRWVVFFCMGRFSVTCCFIGFTKWMGFFGGFYTRGVALRVSLALPTNLVNTQNVVCVKRGKDIIKKGKKIII